MKIVKWFGILLLVIVLAAISGFLVINLGDLPHYEVEQVDYKAKSTPASIERGKKLSMMLCANCHGDPQNGKFTGKLMRDVPEEFGKIYSPNITQDEQHGIGSWTDGEILYLLRTGVKKNGQYAPPYMPKFPTMADEDINAIISFLRSDDKLVAANPKPEGTSEHGFLTKLLCKIAWKPFPLTEKRIAMPDTSNSEELGEYLAHNLDCFSCHSADFKSNNYLDPKLSVGYFGGGNKTLNEKGQVMVTPNLTPDKETGIGNWSKEEFIKAVKYGIDEEEGVPALQYPMMPYVYLTDKEVSAIFDYLQTIPPIHNKVERIVY